MLKIVSNIVFLSLITLSAPVFAEDDSLQSLNLLEGLGFSMQDDILPPDEAYQLSTFNDSRGFTARWIIAEGHYLYRDKMGITVNDSGIQTGKLQLPRGEEKDDPIFNKKLFVYYNETQAVLPFRNTKDSDRDVVFKVKYQGCSEISGICYPPQTKEFTVRLSVIGSANAATVQLEGATIDDNDEPLSEQDQITETLKHGSNWLTMLVFFGAGLLLAFTPCVFPMIPILCGIIVGQGKDITTRKALLLSVVYVLAMALTYTIVGVFIGLSGENIQAWFQNPWIISAFVGIFILLSLSMFGFYDIQMPAGIQSKLISISNSQEGGNLLGVAIMGFLSALIVGPCVTAPLVGALIYIADTGDAVLGGMALFSLSMGMGAPLIVIGASAGKVLPKAGAWMDSIKAAFGVMLLALGIWLLERVAPEALTMGLWAALLIVSAVYMGALSRLDNTSSGWKTLWKGLGIVILIYGIIIAVGLSSGNRNVYQPLKGLGAFSSANAQAEHIDFIQIKGVDGLSKELAKANSAGKTVMLDFYADWCISCKEMEAFTFSDPAVQAALKNTVLLQADVTPNDEQDTELYKRFGIIGPPSIMFFDRDGNERKNFRVVGYVPAEKFAQHVKRALK